MAKKKTTKKHNFKYAQPAGVTLAGASNLNSSVKMQSQTVVAGGQNYQYVVADVKRVLVILALLVVVELSLWFVLSHTEAGRSIYGLLKV